MQYICEWCERSDIPEKDPKICRILYCQKHGCKTWHYPAITLRLTVETHDKHYFIHTTNVSERDIEVTHIWFECDPRVHVLTRELPKRLTPNETWKTYIEIENVPVDNPSTRARARLSTGVIVSSR